MTLPSLIRWTLWTAGLGASVAFADPECDAVMLKVGDVLRLSRAQRVAAGWATPVSGGRKFRTGGNSGTGKQSIVTALDPDTGTISLRPVSNKNLELSRTRPVALVTPDLAAKTLPLELFTEAQKIGTTRVDYVSLRRSAKPQRMDFRFTDVRTFEVGELVRVHHEDQLWLIQGKSAKNGTLKIRYSVVERDGSEVIVSNEQTLRLSESSKVEPTIFAYRLAEVRTFDQFVKFGRLDLVTSPGGYARGFERGDVFDYRGATFLVTSGRAGTYTEQGVRTSETWNLRVVELTPRQIEALNREGKSAFSLDEAESLTQEGGYYLNGDFRGVALRPGELRHLYRGVIEGRADRTKYWDAIDADETERAQAEAEAQRLTPFFKDFVRHTNGSEI